MADHRWDVANIVARKSAGKKGTLSLAPRIADVEVPPDERNYNTFSLSVSAYSPIGGIKPGVPRRKQHFHPNMDRAPRNTLGVRMDIEDGRDYNIESSVVPKYAPICKYPGKELRTSASRDSVNSFKKFFLKPLEHPVVDLSFIEMKDEDLQTACSDYFEARQPKPEESRQDEEGVLTPEFSTSSIQFNAPAKMLVSLKLDNNCLTTIRGLQGILGGIWGETCINLQWLDVSCNKLTLEEIDIADYPNLRSLYLHSNKIERLQGLKVLAQLKKLKVLTLHGNAVEDKKHYRKFVLSLVPSLTKLDFCSITKQDRDNANTWKKMHMGRRRDRD